jgi:hypothetical protein
MNWLGQVSTEHHDAGTLTADQDATVCELMAWGHGANAALVGGSDVSGMALSMWHAEVEACMWSMGVDVRGAACVGGVGLCESCDCGVR